MNASATEPAPRRSYWPHGVIAALLFVIAVQAVLLIVATGNAPLLESETAYADALQYDAVMAERRASAALGWQVDMRTGPDGATYTIRNAAGAPVTGLKGAVQFTRPDTMAADGEAPLIEQAPGVYRAPTPSRAGVFRLSTRLEGGPVPWIDDRRAVLP